MSRPDEDGINLAPNTQTSLSIQVHGGDRFLETLKIFITLKYQRLMRCIAWRPPTRATAWRAGTYRGTTCPSTMLSRYFIEALRVLYIPSSFSFQLCKSNCHKQAIISNCNCSWPELFIPNSGGYNVFFAHIFSCYTFRAWWSPSLRHCAAK